MTFYSFLFLFFAYSFLGWVGEVLYTAVTRRRYQDRGVLSGPLCILYGIGAHLISFALRDLSNDSWFFLAVFSAVYATVIEWVAGHILERTSHTRWWDYSDMPFNLDGYVCLGASALWGVLGVVAVKWGNPLLLALYGLLPHRLIAIILWAALVIFAIDAVGTLLAMLGLRYRWAAGAEIENRLANFTVNTGMALLGWVEQRMNKAHPALTFRRQRRAKSTTFAEGCSPYKIILLFFIGAFLGDITETIFCRITAGYWMSRSSVVWGPFSIVWGLAIAAVTQLLYRYKDRPASWLFVAGTLLGGAYEYLCSVFTEVRVRHGVLGLQRHSRSTWAGASTCCTASSGALLPLPGSRCPVPAHLPHDRVPPQAVRHRADLGAVRVHGRQHRRQLRRAGAL